MRKIMVCGNTFYLAAPLNLRYAVPEELLRRISSTSMLSKWLLAIHLLFQGKNGVSAHELHRTLGITYKSAWFMAHRIRYAMEREPLASKLEGIVEADETYIGGKARGKRGRGAANKTPVVTLVERDGEARSQIMEHVTGKNIKSTLEAQLSKVARLMTDELNVYIQPGQAFASHETVEHGKVSRPV